MTLVLTGLRVSVYTRVAHMMLTLKQADHKLVQANPFSDPPSPELAKLTPFNRVPVLSDGSFHIYETQAILRYLDARFARPAMVPNDPRAVARMEQVIGIVNAYGYWPLVRQVFANRVFAPIEGEVCDEAEVDAGMRAAVPVLDALEAIAAEGLALNGRGLTLADITLAPMIDYFQMAPEGAGALARYPALAAWWHWMHQQPVTVQTRPDLARLAR